MLSNDIGLWTEIGLCHFLKNVNSRATRFSGAWLSTASVTSLVCTIRLAISSSS
jgi:hypothetical protein